MDEPIARINVAPLVDIVLVLLVAMILAISHDRSRALPVGASGGDATEAAPRDVYLDADGRLALDGEPVSLAALRASLREGAPAPQVSLRADSEVEHGALVEVLDALRMEGALVGLVVP